ncbi:hypothetical protein C1878_15460 [Gordonibacter sp. 28C]|uniref:TetR/AcrR family transcriptional regulator n=1 Tax=Gordonibacter sp. 28C TaxID=2078569 RepID=UPI000DF819A5|nr:TetR/AcrR family transcriptional regulator [Gordonibacter sp. 28C]RDB59298.1 hypothetical protein C1878_15460 [Gordonibacter sp. 28C]
MTGYLLLTQNDKVNLEALHAIDRPIDDISVKSICSAIGISRQTFYAHFSSKYDIAYWYLNLSEELYFKAIASREDWRQSLINQVYFLYEEKDYLCNAFTLNPHDIDVVSRFRFSKERLLACIAELGILVTSETTYCVDEYINTHYRTLISWCMRGMRPKPPFFAKICYNCIPNYLIDLLD